MGTISKTEMAPRAVSAFGNDIAAADRVSTAAQDAPKSANSDERP
jgi:hypothetical protein